MSQDISNTNLIQKNSTTQQRDSVVYSVEQINVHLRTLMESQIGVVWIQGEISNFKPHTSGHFYFSLKDTKSQISAVMFRGYNSKLKFKPHDGLEVIVRGKISVYEPRGTYSIACDSMEPVGAGALQKQFEQLREKLKLEGLFDQARKKAIPSYPKNVVIVTSPTGAAIQDILNIMKRRARNVNITIVPTLVQGAAAAPALCEAFKKAEQLQPDVIIIGRGGGSVEDMWCFNDETLARTIAASQVPVISAVGHEIDFTICDFVSDLRAPTPSAAAELVAKSSHEIIQKLEQLDRLLKLSIQKRLQHKQQILLLASRRLIDPKKKLQDLFLRNDDLFSRLEMAMNYFLSHQEKDVQMLVSRLVTPQRLIEQKRMTLQKLDLRIKSQMTIKTDRLKYRIDQCMSLLDSLSPLKVVDRGYSIATTAKKVIRSVKQVNKGEVFSLKVADGEIEAEVKNINLKK